MDVNVDDMLIKSLKWEDHVVDVQKIFSILQKCNIKLNPTKCAFGVIFNKFLIFMATSKWIATNSKKIVDCNSKSYTLKYKRSVSSIRIVNSKLLSQEFLIYCVWH